MSANWKTQLWPQDWKRSVFIAIPKKGNAKECSYNCVHFTSGKVMLQILQARRMNQELCTWTKNFLYKLGLEKAEETEIILPTFIGSWRKQGNSRKTSTSASFTTLDPLTVSLLWSTTNCGKFFKEMEISDHFTCLMRNLYGAQEATVRTRHGTSKWLVQNWERSTSRLYIVTLLI